MLYISTHASDSHRAYLQFYWPVLIRQSALLRQADVVIFSTGNSLHNPEMASVFIYNPSFNIINWPNPGYQAGANLAMSVGIDLGTFDAHDWVVRVNPDVLILDDSWIRKTLQDPGVDGIFVDCTDSCREGNCTSAKSIIHTDFLQ